MLMWRYLEATCPTLVRKWDAAVGGLAAPFLGELAGRLRAMEATIKQVNRKLPSR